MEGGNKKAEMRCLINSLEEPIRQFNGEEIVNPFPGYELESKFDANLDVEKFCKKFAALSEIRPYKLVRRKELHHVYKSKKKIYVLIYAHYGNKELWIKEKSAKFDTVMLNKKDMPALLRRECIKNPSDEHYSLELNKIRSKYKYIGSFKKESLDVYFWYGIYHFSLTLSFASSKVGELRQFEIEFDGVRPGVICSKSEILNNFSCLIKKIFPDYKKRITVQRKIDWLEGLPKV